MGNKIRVSVVVGVLNAERFLAETIESVLSQTYKDWELLLVDDGSSDASKDIAHSYASRYPDKIRCLKHEGGRRRGQGATRNLGMRHSVGEFIGILDHDDVWLPHKLERQVALLDENPVAAMVYGEFIYWNSWPGGDSAPDEIEPYGVPPNRIYEPPELLKLTLAEHIPPPLPTDALFRKDRVCKLGGFEESFIGYMSLYEDQAFFAKVLASFPVFISDECWDRYRIHPSQLCAKAFNVGKGADAERFFLSWVSEYLDFEGMLDVETAAILRRRMWPYRHPVIAGLMRLGYRITSKVLGPDIGSKVRLVIRRKLR
jgi:glycosyltransferase involved in cell wall biosynthesis